MHKYLEATIAKLVNIQRIINIEQDDMQYMVQLHHCNVSHNQRSSQNASFIYQCRGGNCKLAAIDVC